PSFGDIFSNNCVNVGLLTVVLPPDAVDRIHDLAQNPQETITIDLEHQVVEVDDHVFEFDFDDEPKQRLLKGLDPIGLTLEEDAAITAYEARRPAWMA
ncbi:MAG TPA: 3-isopropylmalate dehydratase small subunit, partial [Acidimicrobiia bacterium]